MRIHFFKRPLLWLIIIAVSASGCTRIFEYDQDSQARKALQDLMAIQEKFHEQNKRYAKNLLEIEKYNLKYHTGIVYLEIESAGKDKYRAISLPAESITARVFAYDTGKGGFYEMGDEEVGKYVLGALNHIRKKEKEKNMVDYMSGAMLALIFGFGVRMFARFKEGRTAWVWAPYFLCLLPLAFSVATLNHMNEDVALSSKLTLLFGTGFGLSVCCLILAGFGLTRIPRRGEFEILKGIAMCTILISLFNGIILAQTYYTYSQPKEQRLHFKPGTS